MILKLYSIKDELSEFAAPIPFGDEAQAKRYFRYTAESNKLMSDNPEDFSIWELGTFNTENGYIIGSEPKLIERAKAHGK